MFGKYDINDFFLATIDITYPTADFDTETGLLRSQIVNYEYFTILLKKGHSYIDLQNPKNMHNQFTSYRIKFLEPLSNYYTSNVIKKRNVGKKEAIEASKTYYKSVYSKKS